MSQGDVTTERVIVRRPRHRKTQILQAAAGLFQRSGFTQVTMESIATEVGITVGALYRHFSGKQELLDQVMVNEVLTFEQALRPAQDGSVDELCAVVIDRVLEAPGGTAMLLRHLRSLSPEAADVVLDGLRTSTEMLQRALQREHPHLSTADADLMAWAILAVTGSPALNRVSVRKSVQRDLLLGACRRMCAVEMGDPVPVTAAPDADRGARTTSTRREEILEAVVALSQERGFANVTMEDIGARAGVATSSLYEHFDSKISILGAAVTRAVEALRVDADRAEREAATPREVLTAFAHSYISIALGDDNKHAYFVTVETPTLPKELTRGQRDYVDRWVGQLSLEPRAGRVVVLAALAIVNYLAQTPHLARRPAFATDLEQMVMAVLDLDAGLPAAAAD